MPLVPPASRSHRGTGDNSEAAHDTSKAHVDVSTLEQGDTADIEQNTTKRASAEKWHSQAALICVKGPPLRKH